MGLIVDWLIDDDKDGKGAATSTKPRGGGGCYPSSNWRPAAPRGSVPQLACTKQLAKNLWVVAKTNMYSTPVLQREGRDARPKE